METKLVAILDQGTFISAIAIAVNGEDHYLLRRAGYGRRRYILLANLNKGPLSYNAHEWGSRTMMHAHLYLLEHWDSIKSGAVVDVEHILGLKAEPRVSVEQEGI